MMVWPPPSGTEPPSLAEAVAWAAATLEAAGVEGGRLEAQLLLGHVLGATRTALLAAPERRLTPAQAAAFREVVARRGGGEPYAYIVGAKEWLDVTLAVDRRVLVPRPETELLAEQAIAWARAQGARLAVDVGTGSGALAIALARHVPSLERVVAVDVSAEALEVARANCRALVVDDKVELRLGSLLEPLRADEKPDLLVANLPYVPAGEVKGLQREVRDHEPRLALVGGPRGDELIRALLVQARSRVAAGGALLLEMHDGQGAALSATAQRLWPEARVTIRRDYAGLERILAIDLAAGDG